MNLQAIEAGIAQIDALKTDMVAQLRKHAFDHNNELTAHRNEILTAQMLIAKIEGATPPPAEDQAAAGASFALTGKPKTKIEWRWIVLAIAALVIVYGVTHHLV